MATGTASPEPTPPPVQSARPARGGSRVVEYEQYIDEAVERTQSHVRMVDLAGAVMTIALVTLAFVMFVILIDHWIMPLGVMGRLLAFGVVAIIMTFMGVTMLGPPLLRRINPVYAAHSIEQATPSLKNSLVDLLLFRSNRSGVHASIYQALEANTAQQLSSAPIDAAVDRSHLIKIAYALTGLLILFALYTLISDKSPLTTLARIAAPWSDIAPPSRVTFTQIEPGDTTAIVGDTIEVSALVRGTREEETVLLYYSTADGQVVERPLTMHADEDSLRWRVRLPESSSGVQQDITYYLSAGDGRTEDFQLTVELAPTIVVESIDYEFPSYTGRARLTVDSTADIKGVEGTRVTIHARANREIHRAYIEFDTLADDTENASGRSAPIQMDHDGNEASISFSLQMSPDRRGPLHRSYQLRYVSADNQVSQRNVHHSIEVIRDLPPEVVILQPEQREIHVAENDFFLIEVQARDPDFGIRRLLLRGKAGSRSLDDRLLVDEDEGRTGQVIERSVYVPRDMNLRAGDRATFWAVAEDNRGIVGQNGADPNISRTPEYTVIIDVPLPDDQVRQPPENEERNPNPEQGGEGESDSQQAEGETSSGDGEESGTGETGESGESGSETSEDEPQESEGERQPGAEGSEQGNPSDSQQDSSEGSGDSSEEPFDTEGRDDGDILERAAERARQQQQESEGEPGESGESGEGESLSSAEGEQSSDGEGSENREDISEEGSEQGEEGEGEQSDSSEEGEQTEGSDNQHESSDSEGEDVHEGEGESSEGGEQLQREGEGSSSEGEESGETTGGSDTSEQEQESSSEEGSEQGAGMGDTGSSGAGQGDSDDTGAPMSQDLGEQRQNPEGEGSPTDSEGGPESPSIDDQDSDSESSEGGDRDGGGEEGGGQGSNQEGYDSDGQNSPSDEGNPGAEEQGPGDTGEGAGNQEEAEGATGQQGEGEGEGSESSSSPGSSPGGSSSEGESEGEAPPSEGESEGGSPSGMPTEGGEPSYDEPTDQGATGDVEESEANLQYAREQTDLALRYIEEADEREIEELLHWNDQQRQAFLERWREMERSSDQTEEGAREFEEVLRSLGLRRGGANVRGHESAEDEIRGLSESARDSRPPAAYRDLYDAFRRAGGQSLPPSDN